MALLEIDNLSYRADSKWILHQLSLTVDAGEIHALIGTNGTGKSTLAYLIMGCSGYRPETGRILFAGALLNTLPMHERAARGITLAWQEPARFEGLSVRQYLGLPAVKIDPAPLLQQVGLDPARYLPRQVDKHLSGGERKRIELASLLALQPRLAILDEPDSGIDMLSTGDILAVIDAFRGHGAGVLLITHRQEIAAAADRASLLCDGRIVLTGAPERVAAAYTGRQCGACDGRSCNHG